MTFWPLSLFTRKAPPVEKRASMSGFTAELIAARESYISGRRGIAELSATAQSCISLWENGLAIAHVAGTDYLTPSALAMTARALALRGEAVFLIGDDRLIPCADWDLSTRDGAPRAYRLSISEAGGGRTLTALAGEVVHFRIAGDIAAPWAGQAPLKRAQLTAGLLNAVEAALSEVYELSPLGSLIVPFPESPGVETEALARGFRGKRGRVLIRESTQVTAAGGPAPASDWKPNDLSPDLSRSLAVETLSGARDAILSVFGVLPAMLSPSTTGPLVREGQRHLAQWVLQPLCELIAEEATAKLGGAVDLDCISPLQAFDHGGRARAFGHMVEAMAAAKAAGLTPAETAFALKFIDEAAPSSV